MLLFPILAIFVSIIGVNSQFSSDNCFQVDNKISICRTYPNMPIEEYQNYCPDNYRVCNLRNLNDINYIATLQLPCTVTNIVESRGICDSCNPDNLRTNLIHIGNCNSDILGRSLQFTNTDIIIPISRSQIENYTASITPTGTRDFMPITYQQATFMVNRTILLNMNPEDVYLLPQQYLDTTGKAYKVYIRVIFDKIPNNSNSQSVSPYARPSIETNIKSMMPSYSMPPSRPSIDSNPQTMMPSYSMPPSMRPSIDSNPQTMMPSVRPSMYPNMSGMQSAYPTRFPYYESSISTTLRPTPLSKISFDSNMIFTQRPSLKPTSEIINTGVLEQGTCWYNGIVLGNGQIIRNDIGLCTCVKGNIMCQTQKCIQANTFIDNTVNNMDKCISSKRTMTVACCKIPEITCPLTSYFNKETYTCDPLRICINGNRNSNNQCECNEGYFGKNCEKNCRIDIWFNHGICSRVNETIKCNCDNGFSGDFCKIPSSFNIICKNGYPDLVNNKCKCFPGFSGATCQTEIPCVFGRINADKCICNMGYSGTRCDISMIRRNIIPNIIYSPIPTQMRCYRGEFNSDLQKCVCEHGWLGNTCEDSICFMGYYDINSQTCQCRPGWVGKTCNINCRKECNYHGTICLNNTGVCTCDNNWTGNSCKMLDSLKIDIKNLDKLEIKISESESLNISTRIGNFNFTINSEPCLLDNCLPISFEFRNLTRNGRILQTSDPITVNYQVESNMTLTMINSENPCTITQSYINGKFRAQPGCDGIYNLILSSISTSSNSEDPIQSNTQPPTSNNSPDLRYLGFIGFGVLIIGSIVVIGYIRKNKQAEKSKVMKTNITKNSINLQKNDRDIVNFNPINVR
jgi:hypothetical protein